MSLFTDFVEGFTSGLVSAVSDRSAVTSVSGAVETCCGELGWSIDERLSANEVRLHFTDPIVRIRKVLVSTACQGAIVGFTVYSAVAIAPERVPADVLAYLLRRNREAFVGWEMDVADGASVFVLLTYRSCRRSRSRILQAGLRGNGKRGPRVR